MALGFVACRSDALALGIIKSNGADCILNLLQANNEDHIKAACAWSLGMLGMHGETHARELCERGVLSTLCIINQSTRNEDLHNKI